MNFKKIVLRYKESLVYRIIFQSVLLIIVYIGIQTWQSLGVAKGAAPIILDQTLNGKNINLSHYKTEPVIVYFWAEWCPVCRFENPTIDGLAKEYKIISIATFAENKHDVINYLNDENIDMPTVFDENNEWAKLYKVSAVPTTFIIDSQGEIRFVEKGFTSSIGLKLRLWWITLHQS